MAIRVIAVLALLGLVGNGLCAQQQESPIKVGDLIALKLTGELAKEYARRTGNKKPPDGLQIGTIASVAQKLDDGRVCIEHSVQVEDGKKAIRLVTLTATVDSKSIATEVIPKGTPLYASPDAKPQSTQEDIKTCRLKLSDLKGLTLRTWTLSEEIGEPGGVSPRTIHVSDQRFKR